VLQGPALYVYNDAVFSNDDWKGIRMLHESIKEDDPMKVRRFGLGFKSVFHMTGWDANGNLFAVENLFILMYRVQCDAIGMYNLHN